MDITRIRASQGGQGGIVHGLHHESAANRLSARGWLHDFCGGRW